MIRREYIVIVDVLLNIPKCDRNSFIGLIAPASQRYSYRCGFVNYVV